MKSAIVFLVEIVEAVITYQYLNSVLYPRRSKKVQCLSFAVAFSAMFLAFMFFDSLPMTSLAVVFSKLFLIVFAYDAGPADAALHSFILYANMLGGEIITILFGNIVFGVNMAESSIGLYVLAAIISKLMFWLFCQIASHVITKKHKREFVENGWTHLAITPFMTIITVCVMYDAILQRQVIQAYNLWYEALIIFMITLNLIALYMNEKNHQLSATCFELKIQAQKAQLDYKSFLQTQNQLEEHHAALHEVTPKS